MRASELGTGGWATSTLTSLVDRSTTLSSPVEKSVVRTNPLVSAAPETAGTSASDRLTIVSSRVDIEYLLDRWGEAPDPVAVVAVEVVVADRVKLGRGAQGAPGPVEARVGLAPRLLGKALPVPEGKRAAVERGLPRERAARGKAERAAEAEAHLLAADRGARDVGSARAAGVERPVDDEVVGDRLEVRPLHLGPNPGPRRPGPGAARVPPLHALGPERGVPDHAALVAEQLQELGRPLRPAPVGPKLEAEEPAGAEPELGRVELAGDVARDRRAGEVASPEAVALPVPALRRMERQPFAG